MQRYSLGIDIGGTFTDIVVYDTATGAQASHKELTTHDDPSKGVMAALDRVIAEHRIPATAISRVVHATTLFTNALIERKGAVTGLITTQGFRDTLEIGRERKYELYDIRIQKPEPLVPRNLRLEVPERALVCVSELVGQERIKALVLEGELHEPALGRCEIEGLGAAAGRVGPELIVAFAVDGVEDRTDDVE